ncbi:hypothetical protein ASG90_01120 [Nocardioides sp. Soil797]|nr:hypothetical protein ASG90_01120 [Nocardioides sp. Soil797]
MEDDSREADVVQVGTPLAEFEPCRYLPSKALTKELAQYDVILVVAGGPALAFAAHKAGRPVVLQVATTVRWERESITRQLTPARRLLSTMATKVTEILERKSLSSVDVVLVENPVMEAEVARVAPATQVVLAPPGIDCHAFAATNCWNSGGPVVSVGRLAEPRKGWGRMFHAYASLLERMPGAPPLVIAGRGQLSLSDLDELVALGIEDRVTVIPDISPAALKGLLHEGSVFWQTSYEEGLGIAAIEAMAAGLPVVATRTAGTEMSVLDGVTGYLIAQDSELPKKFAKATVQILSGDGSEMSQRGLSRASEEFDSEVTLRRFVDVCRTLVGTERK